MSSDVVTLPTSLQESDCSGFSSSITEGTGSVTVRDCAIRPSPFALRTWTVTVYRPPGRKPLIKQDVFFVRQTFDEGLVRTTYERMVVPPSDFGGFHAIDMPLAETRTLRALALPGPASGLAMADARDTGPAP